MEEVDMIIEKTARQFDLLNESCYTEEQCRMLLNEMNDNLNLLDKSIINIVNNCDRLGHNADILMSGYCSNCGKDKEIY